MQLGDDREERVAWAILGGNLGRNAEGAVLGHELRLAVQFARGVRQLVLVVRDDLTVRRARFLRNQQNTCA